MIRLLQGCVFPGDGGGHCAGAEECQPQACLW